MGWTEAGALGISGKVRETSRWRALSRGSWWRMVAKSGGVLVRFTRELVLLKIQSTCFQLRKADDSDFHLTQNQRAYNDLHRENEGVAGRITFTIRFQKQDGLKMTKISHMPLFPFLSRFTIFSAKISKILITGLNRRNQAVSLYFSSKSGII